MPALRDLTENQRVALAVVALVAFRLGVAAVLGLAEDEAYYRLWGLHLSWGYYDHPPLVALWIAAGQRLFGDNAFGLRFWTVLTPLLGSWLLWSTGETLYPGTRVGQRAVLWLNATLLIGVGGVIVTPDTPSVLLWGLALWGLAKLIATDEGVWWLVVGAAIGLGGDAKFSVYFLGPGVLLWMMATPSRRWFLTRWPWLGALVGFALIAPVLGWNFLHGMPTFHKQFGRIAQVHEPTTRYVIELIGGQIGLLNPVIALFVGLALWRWRRAPSAAMALLVWTTLPFVGYLFVFALRDRVQANWPAPVYPALVLMAAVAAESLPVGAWWARLRATATPLGVTVGALVLLHGAFPTTDFFGAGDPVSRLRGWDGAAAAVAEQAKKSGAEWVAVYGDTVAAEMAAYGSPALPAEAINQRFRYFYRPLPDAGLLTKPALVVVRTGRAGADTLSPCFSQLTPLEPVPLLDGRGHSLGMLNVYLATGAKADLFTTGCD